MTQYMYRMRSYHHLLGEHQELMRQSIYFAKREELNDPVEGFKDVFWQGDRIVWENLFKHYLFCLENLCALTIIGGDEYKTGINDIAIFHELQKEPTEERCNQHKKIRESFLEETSVQKLISTLASLERKVRKEELHFYLSMVNPTAISKILAIYRERNLIPQNHLDVFLSFFKNCLDMAKLLQALKGLTKDNDYEKSCAVLNREHDRQALIRKYEFSDSRVAAKNWEFLMSDFPRRYLSKLEDLLYPEWYVAAFSSRCDDPSLWGYYGDNHRGFCLKFIAGEGDQPSLGLRGQIGIGGTKAVTRPIYGSISSPFSEITYEDHYPEIDFYRSLGVLSVPTLYRNWYTDEKGTISSCADHLKHGEEKWRNEYWQKYEKSKSTKLSAWRHESEFRLTNSSGLISDTNDKTQRTLTYEFSSLDGIIFGINTPESAKLEAIKIIEQKCIEAKRRKFNFYQSYYSPAEGNIGITNLNLPAFK